MDQRDERGLHVREERLALFRPINRDRITVPEASFVDLPAILERRAVIFASTIVKLITDLIQYLIHEMDRWRPAKTDIALGLMFAVPRDVALEGEPDDFLFQRVPHLSRVGETDIVEPGDDPVKCVGRDHVVVYADAVAPLALLGPVSGSREHMRAVEDREQTVLGLEVDDDLRFGRSKIGIRDEGLERLDPLSFALAFHGAALASADEGIDRRRAATPPPVRRNACPLGDRDSRILITFLGRGPQVGMRYLEEHWLGHRARSRSQPERAGHHPLTRMPDARAWSR